MASRESPPDPQRIDAVGPTALGDAVAWARRYASDHGLVARDVARLCVIVEELVTNLIEHGGLGDLQIGMELARRPSALALVIEDSGPPFDPRSATLEDAVPARGGGAGLRLIDAWSEVVGYASENGRNRLELSLRLSDS
jgi:serine/threonine-protein kinase RsbW